MNDKKITYEIPRNVRVSGLFLKLNVKGWVSMILIPSSLSGLTFFLFGKSFTSFVISGLVTLITYISLEVDDKTGYSNYQLLLLAFNKSLVNKKITPKWGGTENEESKKYVYIDIKK
ncbi:hypothetical protein CN514_07635 [Bacillus sp. AFS001701]|uniref:hypothetical protein n=1 Tax=Bacillus sp. AFS001701 TaxID=2033480 RepID=UPI000BF99756|nr:hypothetical protein [Bacillus sp. AFS001701]PET71260.1 hypothetical protein CN514_07635 [Bacillus sp. AFS001701]